MNVRPGAAVRGAGVAVACLVSAKVRPGVLFAAYAGGWFLNKPGLQVFMVVPDTEEPWKRATIPFATSVGAWSTVMLAATTALRRSKVPTPIAAVALGGAVLVLDSLLADLGEARDAATSSAEGDGGPDAAVDR